MLDLEFYNRHNFHMEKVVKWVSENHEPSTLDSWWGCKPQQLCTFNMCDFIESAVDGEFYLINEQSQVTDKTYECYYDKISGEYLIEQIPDLTDEEKEELIDIENVRVYYCPHCGNWGLDGDNC